MRLRLALVLVLVGGCGGEPLTRAEYSKRGEAICAKARRDVAKLEARDLPVQEQGTKAARIADRQVDDLLELEPPRSLEPQRARLGELVDEVRELGREASGAGADRSSRALERIRAKAGEFERVLDSLGLEGCRDE